MLRRSSFLQAMSQRRVKEERTMDLRECKLRLELQLEGMRVDKAALSDWAFLQQWLSEQRSLGAAFLDTHRRCADGPPATVLRLSLANAA